MLSFDGIFGRNEETTMNSGAKFMKLYSFEGVPLDLFANKIMNRRITWHVRRAGALPGDHDSRKWITDRTSSFFQVVNRLHRPSYQQTGSLNERTKTIPVK